MRVFKTTARVRNVCVGRKGGWYVCARDNCVLCRHMHAPNVVLPLIPQHAKDGVIDERCYHPVPCTPMANSYRFGTACCVLAPRYSVILEPKVNDGTAPRALNQPKHRWRRVLVNCNVGKFLPKHPACCREVVYDGRVRDLPSVVACRRESVVGPTATRWRWRRRYKAFVAIKRLNVPTSLEGSDVRVHAKLVQCPIPEVREASGYHGYISIRIIHTNATK